MYMKRYSISDITLMTLLYQTGITQTISLPFLFLKSPELPETNKFIDVFHLIISKQLRTGPFHPVMYFLSKWKRLHELSYSQHIFLVD